MLQAGTLIVEVADDGVGGAAAGEGSGLRGLGDRVSALGGRLVVTSPAGEGTRLRASIPLAPWRSSREPFLDYGHEGDGGLGERLIELIQQRPQDRRRLARARVGPRGRPAAGSASSCR